jgi:hypothetical protein
VKVQANDSEWSSMRTSFFVMVKIDLDPAFPRSGKRRTQDQSMGKA